MTADLSQICPEALGLLGHREIPIHTANAIGRMRPSQQVKVVQLMIAVNDTTVPFAKGMLLVTSPKQLKRPLKKIPVHGIKPSEQKIMKREIDALSSGLSTVHDDYAQILLGEIVATGYVSRLLGNERVADFLQRHHPEEYARLRKLQE